MRQQIINKPGVDFDDPNLSDTSCYTLTGLHKGQFTDLVDRCISITSKPTFSKKQSLGLFLTKLKCGLSHKVLSSIFKLSKNNINIIVRSVRQALMKDFVPYNVGFHHISRDDVINQHTTIFARELIGGEDNVICVANGTYIYIFRKVVTFPFSVLPTMYTKSDHL